MLKTLLLAGLALAIALGGAVGSVVYALRPGGGPGIVTVGGWIGAPAAGSPEADAYSRARVARAGLLPLGSREGIAFVATRDSGGERLRRDCAYTLEGTVPPANLWTLHAADEDGIALRLADGRPSALHSRQALWLAGGAVAIGIGNRPKPGNWLPIAGVGAMKLVLTLYDPPAAASAEAWPASMPQILEVGCGD